MGLITCRPVRCWANKCMINNNRNSHVIFVWALNCTSLLILCNDYPNKRPMCRFPWKFNLINSNSKVTEKKPRSEPPSPPLSGQTKFSLVAPPPQGKIYSSGSAHTTNVTMQCKAWWLVSTCIFRFFFLA